MKVWRTNNIFIFQQGEKPRVDNKAHVHRVNPEPPVYLHVSVLSFLPSLNPDRSMRGLSARSLQHPPEFTQNELVLRSDLTRPLEAMQVVLNARRLSRAFKSPILLNSHRFLAPDIGLFEAPPTPRPCRIHRGLSSQIPWSSGSVQL